MHADQTISLLRRGYEFGPCLRDGADAVETRLMGRPAACLGGRDAAELFYDESKFQRAGAVPEPVRATLFGDGGVQTLDDAAHRHRKALFLSLLSHESAEALAAEAAWRWEEAVERWEASEQVVLFDEAVRVFGAAVFAWVGVPVSGLVAGRRAFDLVALVDGFGSKLVSHLRGRAARKRAERWAGALITSVRAGSVAVPAGSALDRIAWHRDLDGSLLPRRVAAVELLNILRPTVAVAWYVTYAALELPFWRSQVLSDETALHAFCLEVRRYFPLTPVLGARVRQPFTWRGVSFRPGQLALLDVYGTDHDPALWPGEFDPSRYYYDEPDAFSYIPQGGGDPGTGHRCPGEDVAQELLKGAVRVLARLSYDVPPQDLAFPLSSLPTRPRSGFVMASVHRQIPVPSAEESVEASVR